jgi:hypothetical protein
VDRQHDHRRRHDRNRRFGAFAVVAALAVMAAVAILASRGAGNWVAPAGPSPVTPVDLSSLRAARNFAQAYGAFDVPQAISYLADDADISGLLLGPPVGAEGIADELQLNVTMLEAQRFGQILGTCEQTGNIGPATSMRCAFDFHLMGSDELGLGPFTGSYYLFTVRDRLITQASVFWEIAEFSPQVWEPFADWVSTTHPEDAAVMYQDETYSGQRLSVESIALWQRRVPDYVAVQNAGQVRIAERFMAARSAGDVETMLSLLADDGATVLLLHNNVVERSMPTLRLSHDELALALEAEGLLEVTYDAVECRPEPELESWFDAQISCSFRMDNRLRRIEGFAPKLTSFVIGVHGGRVDYLSFPWLNASFPGEQPFEGARFVPWVEGAHPEAGGIEGGFHDGELFRIMGQEVVIKLTPDAIDLLAIYLDEYEAAVG